MTWPADHTRDLAAPTVTVAEAFGPVWQGEGPHAGRLVSFLRLGLCNLHCSWCDTPYTWDRTRYDLKAECPPRTADWIVDQITGHGTDTLVLSGGEPLIHRENVALLEALARLPHEVHVESNGTLWATAPLRARVTHWSISPKIAQDDDPADRRLRVETLRWWSAQPNAILKVVCRDADDCHTLAALLPEWGDWSGRVWVMPEGQTHEEVTGSALRVAEHVAAYGWNLTLRNHVTMYGAERGR